MAGCNGQSTGCCRSSTASSTTTSSSSSGPISSSGPKCSAWWRRRRLDTPDRRAYQIVDVDCGPGNLTFVLAEAGFSVLGLEPYGALVELAREKRRAKRLANLAFSQGDLSSAKLRDAAYDMVVNVHTLYAQASPLALLSAGPSGAQAGRSRALRESHASRRGARDVSRASRAGGHRGRAALSACCGCCRTACSRRRAGRSARTTGARTTSAGISAAAGFEVLEMRRTFLNGASLLVWARKNATE